MIKLPERYVALLILMVVSAIWGGTFFMIKDATAIFPVMGFLVLRFTLATGVMFPLVLRVGRLPTRVEWVWGVLAGALLTGGYMFQTFSMRFNDSGRTGFITSLYAVIVPFMALILLKQPITRRILIGTGLALIGLILLGYAPGGTSLGDGLAILSTFIWALQIVAVSRFPRTADWRIMTILQLGSNAFFCGILFLILPIFRGCAGANAVCDALLPFADPLPTELPLMVFGVALFTAIFASALGFSVQIWAQRRISASEAAIIYAMESPFSAVFGVAFRNEVLTPTGIFGGMLIVIGVIVATVTPNLKTQPAQEPIIPGAPVLPPRRTRRFLERASTRLPRLSPTRKDTNV
jgi:drug/metabolite transporter (DMT)-like permease